MTLHGYSHPVNWFREITKQIEEEGDNKMKFPSIRQKLQDNPAILGLGIIVILLFTLLLHEYLLDNLTVIFEPGSSQQDDFMIAVIHCLLAGYLPAAYFYLIRGTEKAGRQAEADLIKCISPIAWRHINFLGRFEFQKQYNLINIMK